MATRFQVPATRSRKWALALVSCCLICLGCGRSKAEREEQAFRDAGLQKVDVAPVAGVVTVDGAAPEVIDTYSADEIWGVCVYHRKLEGGAGPHTLRLEVLGEHNARAKASLVHIDGVRIEAE